VYNKYIISYSDTVAVSARTSPPTSHTHHWPAAVGASRRKIILYAKPNNRVYFLSKLSYGWQNFLNLRIISQKKGKKSNFQITKT